MKGLGILVALFIAYVLATAYYELLVRGFSWFLRG